MNVFKKLIIIRLALLLAAVIPLLTSCDSGGSGSAGILDDPSTSGNNSQSGNGSPTTAGNNPTLPTSASTTRLKWTAVMDSSAIAGGLEAFKVLSPSDWTVRGGIFWDPTSRNGGVSREYAVLSPDALRGFEYLLERPYFWSETVAQTQPIGSKYIFQGAELRPPMSAIDYLGQIALPQLPYQIVSTEVPQQLPEVATAVRALIPKDGIAGNVSTDAARVRIAFRANGIDFEGEMHAWLEYLQQFDNFGIQFTSWKPQRVFLMYAPAGEIDTATAFLYPLVLSEAINPVWAQLPAIVEQSRVGENNQVLQQNAALATYLQQTSAQTFDLIDQTFRDANAANDGIFNSYDQYLRGVDTWQDPTIGPIELPTGFDQVWTNPATGEYLLANDPNFNPNTTLAGNWTQLSQI